VRGPLEGRKQDAPWFVEGESGTTATTHAQEVNIGVELIPSEKEIAMWDVYDGVVGGKVGERGDHEDAGGGLQLGSKTGGGLKKGIDMPVLDEHCHHDGDGGVLAASGQLRPCRRGMRRGRGRQRLSERR